MFLAVIDFVFQTKLYTLSIFYCLFIHIMLTYILIRLIHLSNFEVMLHLLLFGRNRNGFSENVY